MRKILLTACAVALSASMATAAEQFTVKTTSNGVLTAGQVLDNDGTAITVTSIYASTKSKDMLAAGVFPDGTPAQTFTKASSKMRLTTAPAIDTPDGAENFGNTAFKIEVTEKLDSLILYAEASGDTRSFRLFNRADGTIIDTKNASQQVIGDKVGGSNLGYKAWWTDVEPGTYTLYNTGFGGGFAGLRYQVAEEEIIPEPAPIAWSATSVTLTVGDEFTAPVITNEKDLALTFASSNEALATVDAAGVITLVADATGTATISATFAGNKYYEETTAKCDITVNAKTPEVVETGFVVKTTADGVLAPGQVLENNGTAIVVTSIYASAKNKDMLTDAFFADGHASNFFTAASSKMRLTNAPTVETPDGEENSGNTAFKVIVTEKLDSLNLYAEASGNTRNFSLFNTASGETVNGELRIGEAVGGSNLGYIASWTDVEPGTYTLFNKGFGGGFCGIIYKVAPGAVVTEPAPIAWNPQSVSLKVGSEFTSPVIENEKGLELTFASSNEALATVDAAGVITLVPNITGTAVITATFAGDATYDPTTVNCTINVMAAIEYRDDIVAYEPGVAPVEKLFQASELQGGVPTYTEIEGEQVVDFWAYPAATMFGEDDNIEIKTVYADAKVMNQPATLFGTDFAGRFNVRCNALPTATDPVGTQTEGSSPLVITPKADLSLTIFIRRQTVKTGEVVTTVDEATGVTFETTMWGITANDGKSIFVVNQAEPTVKLDNTLIFSAAEGHAYALCAAVFELKKGETYTVCCRGTTMGVYGIGYTKAPEVGINGIEAGNEAPVEYFNLQGQPVENPAAGLYIRRQGNTVTKVIVK